ncbi:MAG: hypothetical protein HY226_06815 [Candidatus Vogelbacteria bacterium]|nr:hypothetical protein [Candidatus Vogelbacteria bacterium]
MSTQEKARSSGREDVEEEQGEVAQEVDPAVIEALLKDSQKPRIFIPLSWDRENQKTAYAKALAELQNDPAHVELREKHRIYLEILAAQAVDNQERLRLAREAMPPGRISKAGSLIASGAGMFASLMLACVTVPCTAIASVTVNAFKLIPALTVTAFAGMVCYVMCSCMSQLIGRVIWSIPALLTWISSNLSFGLIFGAISVYIGFGFLMSGICMIFVMIWWAENKGYY